jgi:hypothetical protein
VLKGRDGGAGIALLAQPLLSKVESYCTNKKTDKIEEATFHILGDMHK